MVGGVLYSDQRRELRHQEYKRFYEVTDHLGQGGGSIASKMAAAFELRKYPEYTDVIINICATTKTEGPAAKMLKDELIATAEFSRA